MNGMIEQLLWQICKQKSVNTIESCQFYTTLQVEDDTTFNKEIKKSMEECKIQSIAEVSTKLDSLDGMNLAKFGEIVASIDKDESTNTMGVMLYFGDTKVKASDRIEKEILYKTDFLKHCILGLATL